MQIDWINLLFNVACSLLAAALVWLVTKVINRFRKYRRDNAYDQRVNNANEALTHTVRMLMLEGSTFNAEKFDNIRNFLAEKYDVYPDSIFSAEQVSESLCAQVSTDTYLAPGKRDQLFSLFYNIRNIAIPAVKISSIDDTEKAICRIYSSFFRKAYSALLYTLLFLIFFPLSIYVAHPEKLELIRFSGDYWSLQVMYILILILLFLTILVIRPVRFQRALQKLPMFKDKGLYIFTRKDLITAPTTDSPEKTTNKG